jgi:hypothetical protein
VIRIERVTLPTGLRAVAHRNPRGDLVIYVSQALNADCARTTVRKAIRASRRAGWRAGLPPVGVALLVALGRGVWSAVKALCARPAVWTATAATTLVVGGGAAAVFLMPAPHQHISSLPPAHSTTRSGQHGSGPGRHRNQAQPPAVTPSVAARVPGRTSPKPGRTSPAPGRTSPAPGRTSPAPGRTSPAPRTSRPPSPAPSPPARSAAPTPAPSPSPSGGGGSGCVTLLGIRVCL